MQDFFRETSVFITGATGFLGKSLVEKILRTVPRVRRVYILIRPKRGQSVSVRLQQLLQSPVFDRVKQENAGVLEKISPIVGDIGSPGLGLSAEDRILLEENVSVVVHSAATVKLNENLKMAVNVNVRGTERVVQLCKGMTNLKALVYVSTAYANSDLKGVPIQEQVYPAPPNSISFLQEVDALEGEYLEENVKSFIGRKPNTYTFTKAIAESLFETKVTSAGIPACIVRPSMIIGAWKDPMPGWVEGLSGPVGYSLAMASGLLKIFFADPDIIVDVVPVDMVVNTVLTAAWETGRHRPGSLTVYNCCSGTTNPITQRQFMTLLQYHVRNTSPLCRAVWYPHITPTLNRAWYEIQCFLFHYIPAYLMDLSLLLVSLPRKIPRWFRQAESEMPPRRPQKIVTLHKNIIAAARIGEYFTVNGWHFETKNMDRLHRAWEEMPLSEQKEWSFNFAEFTWGQYLPRFCHGLKKFLAKEAETTIPLAKKRNERLRLIKELCDAFGTLGVLLLVGALLWKFNSFLLSSP